METYNLFIKMENVRTASPTLEPVQEEHGVSQITAGYKIMKFSL